MTVADDLKFALRTLRRRPGFVLAVVATLALGIGANTAIFSVVQALLLRPLTVSNPDGLVAIYSSNAQTQYGSSPFALYRAVASHKSVLSSTAAYWTTTLAATDADPPQYLKVALVTDNYFTVLGVPPAIGRTMRPSDPQAPGANPVVVLSNRLWRQRFGANPAIAGTLIHIKGQPLTVIGVAPDRFRGTDLTDVPDVWVPVSMVPLLNLQLMSQPGGVNPDLPFFSIVARLAPGVDVRRAAVGIAGVAREPDWSSPFTGQAKGTQPSIAAIPITEAASSMRGRSTLLRFVRVMVAVGTLTLLLVCLNVANLLMVRASERARELGVRTALGARTRQLAQQLFTESVLLALLGGGIGVVVAVCTLRAFSASTLPGGITLSRVSLGLNARVIAFTFGMSLLTAIAFGLMPAVRASRVQVADVLRKRDAGTAFLRRRGMLLAIQVAISLVLLVGTGLLLRSIRASLNTDIGFDPHAVAAVSVEQNDEGTSVGNNREYMAVISELQRAPGVRHAAASTHVPLAPMERSQFFAGPLPDSGAGAMAHAQAYNGKTIQLGKNHIMGDYFGTMGIALVAGRPFTRDDGPGAQRVVILNESAAHALFPGQLPIGKQVHGLWGNALWFTYTVVGVVRDTKYRSLQDNHIPFAYVPMTQEDFGSPSINFLARSDNPRAALAILQRTLATIAPDLKAPDSAEQRPRLVSEQIDMMLAPQRLAATLLSGFALLALCISAVGVYGTVAYATSRRTAEIGIRMALGAQAIDVLSLVLTETGIAIAAGMALGVVAAAITTRFLTRWLYDVGSFDLLSFGAAIVVVAITALLAALAPSWRAVRIDPVRAIRTSE